MRTLGGRMSKPKVLVVENGRDMSKVIPIDVKRAGADAVTVHDVQHEEQPWITMG